MKFLVPHYLTEARGRETRIAAFCKFVNRTGYYRDMGRYTQQPLVARLEKIDRMTREAKLLCPHKAPDAFRKFLVADEGLTQLDERIRLLKEAVLQLRANAFDAYEPSAAWMVAKGLDTLSARIGGTSIGELMDRHAWVVFIIEKRNAREPSLTSNFDSLGLQQFHMIEREITACKGMEFELTTEKTPVDAWDAAVNRLRTLRGFLFGVPAGASIAVKVAMLLSLIAYPAGYPPLHRFLIPDQSRAFMRVYETCMTGHRTATVQGQLGFDRRALLEAEKWFRLAAKEQNPVSRAGVQN